MNDFEKIKELIQIEDIAVHLLGKPIRGMYRYPGERTPSVKVYSATKTFYDYGRAVGGDLVDLWAHVRQCSLSEALQGIKGLYGIKNEFAETDFEMIRKQKEARELAKQEKERNKERNQRLWRERVERLHEQIRVCDTLLNSDHIPPFSDIWCFCIEQKQLAEYDLDVLCGVYG